MVHLTRIYTRTGDRGETRLSDMSVTRKTDPRVQAYGDVDEANSAIGIALAAGLLDRVREVLTVVQNELFDLGADLSNPVAPDPEYPPLRIIQPSIDRLEGWCDEFNAEVPALDSFILPGGSLGAAHLHLARTITRRAERQAWAAADAYGLSADAGVIDAAHTGEINPLAITYLNRLSDLLFIFTRVVNGAAGDVLWVPGTDRHAESSTATSKNPTTQGD